MEGLAGLICLFVASDDVVSMTAIKGNREVTSNTMDGDFSMLWQLSSFGERLFGAYMALSGMAFYLIAAVRDTIRSLVHHIKTEVNEQQL